MKALLRAINDEDIQLEDLEGATIESAYLRIGSSKKDLLCLQIGVKGKEYLFEVLTNKNV